MPLLPPVTTATLPTSGGVFSVVIGFSGHSRLNIARLPASTLRVNLRRNKLRPSLRGLVGLVLGQGVTIGGTMGNINASVDLRRDDGIAVVTVDNPPVNALKHEVRAGLVEGLRQARDDDAVKAVVVACAGRTFFARGGITDVG